MSLKRIDIERVDDEKKLSGFFARLEFLMKHYRIASINELATKHLLYKSAQKLNRLKGENTKPSADIVADIVRKWPEVNANWLLVGQGEMISVEFRNGYLSNEIEKKEPSKTNLDTIQRGLDNILHHQVWARAEIRAYGQYPISRDAGGNENQVSKVLLGIGRLASEYAKNIAEENIGADGHS